MKVRICCPKPKPEFLIIRLRGFKVISKNRKNIFFIALSRKSPRKTLPGAFYACFCRFDPVFPPRMECFRPVFPCRPAEKVLFFLSGEYLFQTPHDIRRGGRLRARSLLVVAMQRQPPFFFRKPRSARDLTNAGRYAILYRREEHLFYSGKDGKKEMGNCAAESDPGNERSRTPAQAGTRGRNGSRSMG